MFALLLACAEPEPKNTGPTMPDDPDAPNVCGDGNEIVVAIEPTEGATSFEWSVDPWFEYLGGSVDSEDEPYVLVQCPACDLPLSDDVAAKVPEDFQIMVIMQDDQGYASWAGEVITQQCE